MNTKTFKGKAIYNPSGKAGEYSYWACNFYKGCSNGCTYCYLKKGVLNHALGGDKPELKQCFKDEKNALEVFEKELMQNLAELQKHGLFFSFTTDPMLKETIYLTLAATAIAIRNNVPVKILTKNADFLNYNVWVVPFPKLSSEDIKLISFGLTLTGHDDLEPNASTNVERINAAYKLKQAGFKIFFSIEPIVDFMSSWRMICDSYMYCDLFKIGLMSGKKYDKKELISFIKDVNLLCQNNTLIYWKDTLLQQAGITRDQLPENCVTRKYNIFTGGDECLVQCVSCEKEIDIEDSKTDSEDNYFCKECYEFLAPIMQKEYDELAANGEIEP